MLRSSPSRAARRQFLNLYLVNAFIIDSNSDNFIGQVS